MALIKCKECGSMISDRATKCPKCGCPIGQNRACSECGEQIPEGVSECPNCGCPTTGAEEIPVQQEILEAQPIYYSEDNGGRSHKWLYVLIALLLAIIAGGGYYVYSSLEEKDSETDANRMASVENKEEFSQLTVDEPIDSVEETDQIMEQGEPDWLQGVWRLELTDNDGGHMGYMFEVFNHGKSKSYINDRFISERDYTITDDMVVYDKGHYQLDRNRQIVKSADGREMQKVSNIPSYKPTVSSSSNQSSDSYNTNYGGSDQRSYRFSSEQDVIGYLADKTFYNGSDRLRIRPDGVWVNDYCATFAPTVERYESWKALIRAITATGQRVSLLVDPIHGQVIDSAGDVYSLR